MPEQVSQQVWKLSEYGVAGIVLAVILICAIALVAWMLRQFEKSQIRLDAAHERMHNERAKWFEVTTALKSAIDTNNSIVLQHNQRADEAAKYVREEHQKMCECLQNINSELKLKPCLIEK